MLSKSTMTSGSPALALGKSRRHYLVNGGSQCNEFRQMRLRQHEKDLRKNFTSFEAITIIFVCEQMDGVHRLSSNRHVAETAP